MLNSDFFKSQKSDRKVKIQRAKKSKSLKSVPSCIAYMLPDPGRQQKTDYLKKKGAFLIICMLRNVNSSFSTLCEVERRLKLESNHLRTNTEPIHLILILY